MYSEEEAWSICDPDDMWILDKLILSKKLGYNCGPVGIPVSIKGNYIIRPCVNVFGMSRGAEISYLENKTDHLEPGYFWCEIFQGRHLSIDYINKEQILSVEGFRDSEYLYRYSKWIKTNDIITYPKILNSLKNNYKYINVEFIGEKIIEIHLRNNPDFKYGNEITIPVWNDQKINPPDNFEFVEDSDFKRVGLYIK